MAAIITAPLALGAKASVRGAKVVQKEAVAAKVVRTAARAEISKVEKAATVAAVTVAAAPAANASELGEDLFAIFDTIDKAADKVESALDVAADVAGKVAVAGKSAADIAAPVVERAAVAAKPIGEAGLRYAERTVGPVANDAASKVTGAAGQAISGVEGAIKAKGIDVEPVAGVVGKAGAVAADFASSSVAPAITDFGDFLSTASPTELVEVAAVAGGAYLLAPALLGVVGGAIRGYAGFVRPVEAYDEVLSGGNIVVVDVRSELDAERGTPLFPRRAANKYKSVPREKLQGNFKNMGEVEATLTATKVASLKGVTRGTKVLVLDNNGRGDATKVAKALGAQGFGKVFVVEGGYNGWVNAGLAVAE